MSSAAMPQSNASSEVAKKTPFHIAVIGSGAVGSNTAFAVMTSDIGQGKVTLTDIATDMLRGQVMDLEDTAGTVEAATSQEAGQADIIIVTAGRGLKDGETRLDCLKSNYCILRSVIGSMMPIKKTAVIIVVSNPCDILAYFVWKFSGLPSEQVIGSGTLLDTVRLRAALSEELGCHNDSIDFNILGEHGDSQFPATSLANIGGIPLTQYPGMENLDMEAIAKSVREKGRLIREAKGATMFGVATSCKTISEIILKNQSKVVPVSVKVPGRECYLSLPCVLGFGGVEKILDVSSHLNSTERAKWEASLAMLKQTMKDVSNIVSAPALAPVAPTTPSAASTPFHIAVIGSGAVGSNTAFSIMTSDIGQGKVTLTDIAADMLRGQVMDLEDTAGAVAAATPQEAGQADIIILTAGRGLKDGETRLDCLKSNHGILKSVIGGMMPIKKTAVIIVVSNPCDILAYFVWKFSGLPSEQVIGSGTLLDTVRLRAALASELGCNNKSIDFNILGEHGDSQFPATSLANIGGIPLAQYPGMEKVDMDMIAKSVREKGRLIREAKGATMFGVASSCTNISESILKDEKRVLPVSVKVPGRECFLSLPCIVGAGGCEKIIDVTAHLSSTERDQWDASLQKLEETMKDMQDVSPKRIPEQQRSGETRVEQGSMQQSAWGRKMWRGLRCLGFKEPRGEAVTASIEPVLQEKVEEPGTIETLGPEAVGA